MEVKIETPVGQILGPFKEFHRLPKTFSNHRGYTLHISDIANESFLQKIPEYLDSKYAIERIYFPAADDASSSQKEFLDSLNIGETLRSKLEKYIEDDATSEPPSQRARIDSTESEQNDDVFESQTITQRSSETESPTQSINGSQAQRLMSANSENSTQEFIRPSQEAPETQTIQDDDTQSKGDTQEADTIKASASELPLPPEWPLDIIYSSDDEAKTDTKTLGLVDYSSSSDEH